MSFTTYENKRNPHITIHRDGCWQIKKRGGQGEGHYEYHRTYSDAKAYAKTTGLPIIDCSFCKPS